MPVTTGDHPRAVRISLVTACAAAIISGGIVGGVLGGIAAGVFVAALALLGGGGAAWLLWPRDQRPSSERRDVGLRSASICAFFVLVVEIAGYFQIRHSQKDIVVPMLVVIAVSAAGAVWLAFLVRRRGRWNTQRSGRTR